MTEKPEYSETCTETLKYTRTPEEIALTKENIPNLKYTNCKLVSTRETANKSECNKQNKINTKKKQDKRVHQTKVTCVNHKTYVQTVQKKIHIKNSG